jgi:hypothetical protein
MTTLQRLSGWKDTGAITADQYNAISAIVRKDRFSVFFELNALLYLGVLSFIGGVAWVIRVYVATLGDVAILSGLTLILLASFYYCFSRTLAFSPAQVESPNLAFDYVLYLGCLTFGIEIGYIESRFQLMQSEWDYYLLISAVLFFVLAYRFDNRFVLSLALSTLAGWFGLRMSRLGFFSLQSYRPAAFLFGIIAAVAGAWLYRLNIKKHFTETYFHIAAIVLFVTVLSGVLEDKSSMYLVGLLLLSAAAIIGGFRFKKFSFFAYGIVFAYIGVSFQIVRSLSLESTTMLGYVVVSSVIVVITMVVLARRFGREA